MELDVHGHGAYCYGGGKVFDGALPTAVFIHGAQNDHSVWALQSRYMAHHGYSVLAVDLPGHGRSSGPALDSVEAMAQWVLDLLNALGVQRAILAGHSMGSLIALEAVQRAPALVVGLAMVPAPTSHANLAMRFTLFVYCALHAGLATLLALHAAYRAHGGYVSAVRATDLRIVRLWTDYAALVQWPAWALLFMLANGGAP